MLHVTNGDVVVATLRAAGVEGEHLSWLDVLHEGPVPAVDDGELREVRARFTADRGWAPYEDALEALAVRDRALVGADERTLWFEADLFDQLQLIQILDLLAREGLSARMICIGAFPGRPRFAGLGELDPDELRSLVGTEQKVTFSELTLARSAWSAFRSPDPADIPTLLDEDTEALPFLRGALVRHLEQFPSVENGLSRLEHDIVELAAERPRARLELFRAQSEREARPYLGDTIFLDYVAGLASASTPFVAIAADGTVSATRAGEAALRGEADFATLNGLDRWLGGVHLAGGSPGWRWDRAEQTLEAQ